MILAEEMMKYIKWMNRNGPRAMKLFLKGIISFSIFFVADLSVRIWKEM